MKKKMHLVNRFLGVFGLQMSRIDRESLRIDNDEKAFMERYEAYFNQAVNNRRGFEVLRAYRYNVGEHPFKIQDLEFEFTSYYLYKLKPENILDIGSYRHFILGLLAHYDVTTLDIRERKSILDNENIVTCNAKSLEFIDGSFGAVVSLEAVPHFGLGRYGDDFDLDADIKAFNEMKRVLKPEGYIIFSTAITRGRPSIAFNARRNYSHGMIRELCGGLECIEEKFIDRRKQRFCSHDDITTDPEYFDYYIGCWKKRS